MDDNAPLFDLTDYPIIDPEQLVKTPTNKVWTENKASLIHRYLRYFVFITRHGTYIDGFSGPQDPTNVDSWAAKRVIESEPRWLRNFVFFEKSKLGTEALAQLVAAQPSKPKRNTRVVMGDTNIELPRYLAENPIKDKEATFCLLDQRTFECNWATVECIAGHKKSGSKIELFYFLAEHWMDRAIAVLKKDKEERLERWWGNSSWRTFKKLRNYDGAAFMAKRFKEEFDYKFADPYPIYQRDNKGGAIMFWMIHASDHPEARKLMVRAYNSAVAPLEPQEQLELELHSEES